MAEVIPQNLLFYFCILIVLTKVVSELQLEWTICSSADLGAARTWYPERMRTLGYVVCGIVGAHMVGCAYDTKKKEFYPELPLPLPPVMSTVREAREEREEVGVRARSSVHLVCEFQFAGDPVTQVGPCSKVTFVLLDSSGRPISRKIPDSSGKVSFPISGSKGFRIRPDVKQSWKVVFEPDAVLRAGDTVRITITP